MAPKRPGMQYDTQRERERREPTPRERDPVIVKRKQDTEEAPVDIKEIEGQIKKDAVQNPLSISAFLVCGLSVIYLVSMAPFVGGGVPALLIAISSGIVGVCSGGWMLWIRGEKKIKAKIEEIARLERETAERAKEEDLLISERNLRLGFAGVGSREGSKALEELVYEWERIGELLTRLESSKKQSTFSVERVKKMVLDAYKQGLSVLADALEMMILVKTTDTERIRNEIADLERRNNKFRNDESYAEIVDRNETAIREKNELLEKLHARELSIEKLLDESDRCETTLQEVRIEIPNLTVESSNELDKIVLKLRTTMDYASQLQEKLHEEGF